MQVRVLEYVEYPPGEHWRVVKVPDPPWADSEAAVRRLDRYRFPFLILWPSADEAEHELSGDFDAFEVMGGQGAGGWPGRSAGTSSGGATTPSGARRWSIRLPRTPTACPASFPTVTEGCGDS